MSGNMTNTSAADMKMKQLSKKVPRNRPYSRSSFRPYIRNLYDFGIGCGLL